MQPNFSHLPGLSHLDGIDPRFLDPSVSLVVIPEIVEMDIHDVRLALEGLSLMLDHADDLNKRLRKAGQNGHFVEVPADALSAIFRVLGDKLSSAGTLPTVSAMQDIRPDLFNRPFGGV